MIKLAVLAVFWFMAFQCFEVVKNIEPLKDFIPHEILGVDPDASVGAVKKAYRKLSREKHPDKNPDNPEAVNEFITITKAYTVSDTLFTFNQFLPVDHDRRESQR
jgi:preprotein translocase subunit Sec63